jgi:ribosomal protein S18 acetylase RimI-like enzyme
MVNQIVIRQTTESDILDISRLQQQWFDEASVYGFVPQTEGEIMDTLGPFSLVAETDNQIVGFISGSVRSSSDMSVVPQGESHLEIDNLYVAPKFHGQGIGGSLTEELLARARQQGLTYATLYSATKDIHSVLRFYERHGFRSWYVQMFRKL